MAPEDPKGIETASLGGVTRAMQAAPGFEPGTRVGDYEILNAIGAGGMGEVYRVRNVISDRTEAMKVLLPSLTQRPELAERFTREIKVQATMRHPNIAGLHTALHFNNQLVMVMEYVEGIPLDQRLTQGPIPLPDCLNYVSQVLRALSYAHQRGIIHRDIKPSNIMLCPDGTVKLMDFGIANVANDPKLTGTGMTLGSPYYMSPEQIRGETPDPRSDIYSLGITLYELVTGRRPINGDSHFSIMSAHLNDAPTPPIALDHTLPADLNDIILMSIAKQPERRFQTADAFLNALEGVRAALGSAGVVNPVVVNPNPVAVTPVVPNPPPASAPSFVPLPPPPAATPMIAPAPKSHRGLYMALGAIAALGILAVAGLEAPKWFRTSARNQMPATVSDNSKPAPPTPAQTTAAPVVSEPAAGAAVPVVPETLPPVAAAPPRADTIRTPDRKIPEVQKAQLRPDTRRLEAQPDVRAPSSPAVPPQQAAQASQPPAPAVSNAELQKIEDRMAQLTSRMSSLDRSLQRLEQSQNASGLGMRGDFVQTRDMMHSFAGQAEAALRNQDTAAATRYLDRAEIQVDRLAKALNQ